MPDPRVLVVDDEEGPREAIRMILKPHYQVFTAGSGEEALASLPRVKPDVIFMDVKMPRMDGVQLLEHVKALDQNVEVVMITAYASLDTVQRAMRFGAMDYLVKPFAPKELREAATRAMARRQERADGPPSVLAQLIAQMRELVHRDDPAADGASNLTRLLRAMLAEAQRATGALGASFFGTEPAAVVHSELAAQVAGTLADAWRAGLGTVREPAWLRPGATTPLPWPAGTPLEARGVRSVLLVPVTDNGQPRVAGHLTLFLATPPVGAQPDPTPLRAVVDLMVTAIRTSVLQAAAARQAAEQSLRAVQGEILRQISTAVLEDPSLDRTLAAITEQLQQGAGYERVQVLLEPTGPPEPDRPRRAVFPLVAQGRRLGYLVVEASPTVRDLDPSERELLRMFSESVALIVRNANLHRELSEANAFLEGLIESAADAIIALDPERRVVTWNPSAARMFGQQLAEVYGRPVAEALPPSVVGQLEPAAEGARGSRITFGRAEAGDQGSVELTLTSSPMAWGGRGETGLLLIAKDVTEQRRWEQQMARSEKLAALGQLAMGMAHDFNNLLQAILGHAQLIAHEPSRERLAKGLGTIEHAVRDGVEMIGRIKRYARREGERGPEPVDLHEVVRQVVEITRPRWTGDAGRGVRVAVHQELNPVPFVRARGAELREVLINLVLNAADAMPRGGSITLSTRPEGSGAILAVADTGPGIPPELRRRIFEPFFTTKEQGTGLGLSIVSGIVSGYGGRIDVEAEVGQGTTFTIWLPAAGPGPASGT